MQGLAIQVTGIVQGVGFRPFVYHLARRYGLNGWVRNTSQGVDIRLDGEQETLSAFVDSLRTEAPPLSHIDSIRVTECPPDGFSAFEIHHSAAVDGAFQPISPDIALCADCRRELLDPSDRRYRYPFINCTNCGPRFTIIKDIPYDRPFTTMADFPMCEDCAAEYHDPADRRFHAQPVACPVCGPGVWLENGAEQLTGDDAIRRTVELLKSGAILAIKGLGGFHLACDATHTETVAELRRRKHRIDKPFALMMADVAQIERYCHVDAAERALLTSPAAPIVLLNQREDAQGIADGVAPMQNTLGVMIPYTPLHLLLFADGDMPPLVMTSGNHAEEPVVTTNDDAKTHLAELADAFLLHNRDIHIRTDDSVMRIFDGAELPIRRSRGYAPFPVRLPMESPPLLAVGAEMKNTFCLTRDGYAFMSHHIGNMENYATLTAFESGIDHFERLFRAAPQVIVHDLHPDYWATRYALKRSEAENLPRIAVQHHHAHIAACMAENGHRGETPVIGVCFDGTGYGTDGTIWGGEYLIADYDSFERAAYLKPLPLPGGDASTRKPSRIAYAYLLANGLTPDADLPPMATLRDEERHIIAMQIERGINTPMTSSMGRVFDAVASLLDVCHAASYEGQAAIELEVITDTDASGLYPLPQTPEGIDTAPMLSAILAELREGVPAPIIAGRFHNTVAHSIRDVCVQLSAETGLSEVALSGGVFQNVTLLKKVIPLLQAANLRVLTHRRVPPNDGGLALGQAVIGAWNLLRR